jgi:hypothetical protein
MKPESGNLERVEEVKLLPTDRRLLYQAPKRTEKKLI